MLAQNPVCPPAVNQARAGGHRLLTPNGKNATVAGAVWIDFTYYVG